LDSWSAAKAFASHANLGVLSDDQLNFAAISCRRTWGAVARRKSPAAGLGNLPFQVRNLLHGYHGLLTSELPPPFHDITDVESLAELASTHRDMDIVAWDWSPSTATTIKLIYWRPAARPGATLLRCGETWLVVRRPSRFIAIVMRGRLNEKTSEEAASRYSFCPCCFARGAKGKRCRRMGEPDHISESHLRIQALEEWLAEEGRHDDDNGEHSVGARARYMFVNVRLQQLRRGNVGVAQQDDGKDVPSVVVESLPYIDPVFSTASSSSLVECLIKFAGGCRGVMENTFRLDRLAMPGDKELCDDDLRLLRKLNRNFCFVAVDVDAEVDMDMAVAGHDGSNWQRYADAASRDIALAHDRIVVLFRRRRDMVLLGAFRTLNGVRPADFLRGLAQSSGG
jgi:hypothetical protein